MRPLLDAADASRGLRRLAGEIVERHRGVDGLMLVGIRRGGVPIAEHLAALIAELEGPVPVGNVDISLYRDDAGTSLPNPRIGPTYLPQQVENRRVVLCDDVLFTGRTVRAAVDALLDYGRPAQVELAVLVDRGGRELPIQADYLVKRIELDRQERADVLFEEKEDGDHEWTAVAVPMGDPSSPPPGERTS